MGKRAARNGARRAGGPARPRSGGGHAPRRGPRALLVGGLLALALVCGAVLSACRPGDNDAAAHDGKGVPASGPGTFTPARASGAPVGTGGPLRRYRVLVENGVDLSPAQAATEIQAILAHPRGWAAHGRGRFQLVSGDRAADVTIKIATPATTDKLCAVNGDTHGELNCEVTDGVVVNLKRWVKGSPQYDGPPAEYRHLIINHEIGHLIGFHGHMACPGPGRPAPVMQQQIKGLNGCTSNAWPYTESGGFVEGPSVP
ncbi:DUF3152 domain-containing protein [Streptomyces sp. NPDC051597]|uniref:DUF3152 domain-containing protein n=1 Tax=Streptomyces sp. NPDC051597 TaxID=3155049 RepID=UPI003413C04F